MYLNDAYLGSLKHLPPTLLAQYHFTNFGAFKPYVGAGINYTHFSSVNLPAGLDVKRSSWGGALQVGFDYALDKNWSLNFDVKKVYIDTKINNNIGKLKVDHGWWAWAWATASKSGVPRSDLVCGLLPQMRHAPQALRRNGEPVGMAGAFQTRVYVCIGIPLARVPILLLPDP